MFLLLTSLCFVVVKEGCNIVFANSFDKSSRENISSLVPVYSASLLE